MGYKVGKGYSPTFRDEVFSEVHIQNPARIPDRVMIVYVSTPAPEHYRIDLPEIERPADVSEREERILLFRSHSHTTSKLAIIIMSSCSRLWQWKTYFPL
jgi:hypothetical protein